MQPIYMSASHVSLQSRTRFNLNRVFFVRFLVSPKFSHVPLGVGRWPLGTKSEDVGLIVRAIRLQDFHVITIHQRYRRKDGQTDDMRSQDRDLHYI